MIAPAVLYTNAHIVPNLMATLSTCEQVGAELLVDAYHALNAIPFSLRVEGLEGAYVVGGGYKYCQLGPGNAFLRFPADTTVQPVVTGWFSEFTDLTKAPSGRVEYGPGPARFAGARTTSRVIIAGRRCSSFLRSRSSRRRGCGS